MSTHPAPHHPPEADADPEHAVRAEQWAQALIHSRRTTLPKRLRGPGPNAAQQAVILQAAAAAPDHDQHLPWRFVEVPAERRDALADAFANALQERDSTVAPEQLAQAREKAHRGPWLLLLVCRVRGGDDDIDAAERLVSAGCAVQNILLMATALGLGSALTSGKALKSHALRQLFGLSGDEDAICFINIGEVVQARAPRPRPEVAAYFSRLGA